MFEALHERLAMPTDLSRILCGDFNAPRTKGQDGSVEVWGYRRPAVAERWDAAERRVILGLAEHDLPDLFRARNGYAATDVSWVYRRGSRLMGQRYDHIFASPALRGVGWGCRLPVPALLP